MSCFKLKGVVPFLKIVTCLLLSRPFTDTFIIYAMRQRARADHLTIRYCEKQIS